MAKKSQKKKTYVTEEVLDASNELAVKTEGFLEKNAKVLGIVFGTLIVAALGYFAYLKYVVEPKTNEGFSEFYQAQKSNIQDSLDIALNGTVGGSIGYEGIIEEFGGTDPANLSKYQAAIIYYKKGDYKTALERFESFSTKEPALLVQKNGMIGNCLVESDKLEDGLKYYVKAAESSELEVLETMYLLKAGKLALHLNKNDEALGYFTKLEEKYPNANSGEALKYIEMLKYSNAK